MDQPIRENMDKANNPILCSVQWMINMTLKSLESRKERTLKQVTFWIMDGTINSQKLGITGQTIA